MGKRVISRDALMLVSSMAFAEHAVTLEPDTDRPRPLPACGCRSGRAGDGDGPDGSAPAPEPVRQGQASCRRSSTSIWFRRPRARSAPSANGGTARSAPIAARSRLPVRRDDPASRGICVTRLRAPHLLLMADVRSRSGMTAMTRHEKRACVPGADGVLRLHRSADAAAAPVRADGLALRPHLPPLVSPPGLPASSASASTSTARWRASKACCSSRIMCRGSTSPCCRRSRRSRSWPSKKSRPGRS